MKTFWKILIGSCLGCLAALTIAFLISIGLIGSLASSGSTPKIPSQDGILRLDLGQPVSEQTTDSFQIDLTGAMSVGNSLALADVVKAIDTAAEDPAIKFIYMHCGTPSLTLSQAEEIRAALLRFRQSGKAIVACSDTYDNLGYYMHSVADRVIFHAYGTPQILGISSSVIFFKDLIDRLGVEVQLIRHGRYKAAGEQFTKSGMTPDNYEQNKTLIDATWKAMCSDICASRDFTEAEFNGWLDRLELVDAFDLLDKGLVDELMYEDQLEDYICSIAEVDKPEKLKMVTLEDYIANLKPSTGRDAIALVYANGEIMADGEEGVISGIKTAGLLREIRRDSSIKAVVLRVNSPGGDAMAAEMINREISLLREVKPVIASYGDYAASGGYWISAGADHIFTDRMTITGSIGVFSMIPSFGKALSKKVGVNIEAVNSNRHSDMLSLMRPLDNAEQGYFLASIEKVYEDFLERVATGRNMDCKQVDELGQGRIWSGSDAVANGLADEIGGLCDAIAYAELTAGLEKGRYSIKTYPVVKTFAEKLMESFAHANAAIEAKETVKYDPMKMFEQAYGFLRESYQPVTLARIPYLYQIR